MTKARTKAQRRRGRPRLPPDPAKRGRIATQQAKSADRERDAMHVALNARVRHYGVITDMADPRLGYELGRLAMFGRITSDQFDAGMRFGEDMWRYYALSGVKTPSAKAQNLFSVPGEAADSDDRAERSRIASQRARRLQGLLLAAGSMQEGRDTLRIVMAVVVSDEALGKSERALFLLRRGLNVLAKHYRGR